MLEDLNLQKIVLIMAVVAFIFAVIVIYYKSLPTNQNIKWPPVTTKCPDYWDLSRDGIRCVNTSGMNKGKLNYATCNKNKTNSPCCKEGTCYIQQSLIYNNKQRYKFKKRKTWGPDNDNDRKNWARKNGFVWDGIYSG